MSARALIESQAKAGVEAAAMEAPAVELVSRAALVTAGAVGDCFVIDDDDADIDDETLAEFAAALRRVQARRRDRDWGAVAERLRAHPPTPKPVTPARALTPALSRDGCANCGAAGWKGCDHQAAYEPGAPIAYSDDRVGRRIRA